MLHSAGSPLKPSVPAEAATRRVKTNFFILHRVYISGSINFNCVLAVVMAAVVMVTGTSLVA